MSNMRDFQEDFSGARNDDHLIEMWLSGRPDSTKRVYRFAVDKFRAFLGDDGIRDVTVATFVAYIDTLDGAPATQQKMVTVIKSLLSYAYKTGYTVFNVGKAIKCPKVPDTLHERILDEESVARIIATADTPRDKALTRFFYSSGARISEVSKLSWKDIQGRRVTLQGKGCKNRTILLPQSIIDALLVLRREDDTDGDPVFRSAKRLQRLKPRSIRWIIQRIANRVNVKLAPHWFRHAHASHALDNGAPVHLVQRSLGHKNVATTSRYLHARPNTGASEFLSA